MLITFYFMSLSTKRSATATTDAASSAASSSATRSPHPMKKDKSQAVACSIDSKNGLHHHQDFNSTNDVVFEPAASIALDDYLKTGDPNGRGVVTANLSLKKATPPQPSKKLLIKLHKGKPTLPQNFEEDTWAKLKSAICAIFLKQPDSCDLEKLYQVVSDLCLYKMGRNLYQRIEKECEAHISAVLQSLVGQSPDLVVFLSLVERCWQDLCD